MKKIYLFVLSALFLAGCSQNKNFNSLKQMEIKGNVTNITDTVWQVKEMFGEVVKTGIDELIKYEFNDKGNITSQITYGDDGKISEKTVKEYNEEGKILSDKTYKADGSLYYSNEYTYTDSKNYTLYHIWNGYTKSTKESKYFYTKERLDSICCINIEEGKKTYTKDIFEEVDDKCTRNIAYRENGNIDEMMQYVNDNKKIIKIEGINTNLLMEWTYKDDLTTSYSFRSDDWSEKSEYKHKLDDKGNWIERIEYFTNNKGVTRLEKMTTRYIQYK